MREQFMRIAMARLRSTYPFKPQRRAVAAKMWVRYLDRKAMQQWFKEQQEIARQEEWQKMEDALNKRMDIIGQNGNTADGYLKTCVSCNKEKAFIDFSNNNASPDGKHSYCKECSNQKNKEWREKNSEKNKQTIKKWKEANADKIREYKRKRKPTEKEKDGKKRWTEKNAEKLKEYQRQYKKKNQKRLNELEQKRKQVDPVYRIVCSIRSRVSALCKSISEERNLSATKSIGLNRDEFKKYIESKFQEGMTWENYGEWHIDHIKPLSTATTEEQVMELNHYTNLQPLWAIENLRKSNK